ncbi:MAG: hypothetical protein HON16_01240, partial [Euryarchaeota archaeon]|nr:hypothetical protein [Euryarchaeota archaeon]
GIGPPPDGCGGGPGAQLEDVELVSSQSVFSPYTLMMILLLISALIWRKRK